MARKVLISFLGTGTYTPVYYSWNGKKTTDHPTKFIQEAIAAKLCCNWSAKDCIMVFRTNESNQKNWLDSNDSKGLDSVLKGMTTLRCSVNPERDANTDSYMIPAGFTEQETEEIFKAVFDKLEVGDEVYFDMTHAFRSIPIFANSLFNYARFLKNVKVKGVYYGAFEKLGPGYLVKEWSPEQIKANPAPIVDMTNMVHLQDLTTAAASFKNAGHLSAFSDLLADSVDTGLDESVDHIKSALSNLDLYIQTSRIPALKAGEYMKTISSCIENFCDSPLTSDPQRKLMREIMGSLTECGFKPKEDYCNVEAAIKWAIDHRMILQAYTMGKEYLISIVFDILQKEDMTSSLEKELKAKGRKIDAKNRVYELRNAISQILKGIYRTDRGYYVMDYKTPWHTSEIAKSLLKLYQNIGKLGEPYEVIAESRNILAHAGATAEDTYNFEDYQNEFATEWENCQKVLEFLK